jgi:hypothetical protein
MRKAMLVGCGVAVGAGLATFAATGLGGSGSNPQPVETKAVGTHAVEGRPAAVARAGRAASLFRVIYKESQTITIPDGVTPYNLGACPKRGAVLSAWHIKIGADKAGLLATGSTPTSGSRRVDYVVTNTTGGDVEGRLGLVCIK